MVFVDDMKNTAAAQTVTVFLASHNFFQTSHKTSHNES